MPRVFTSVSMVATSSTIIARISSEVLVAINTVLRQAPLQLRIARCLDEFLAQSLHHRRRHPGGAATPNQFATFSLP